MGSFIHFTNGAAHEVPLSVAEAHGEVNASRGGLHHLGQGEEWEIVINYTAVSHITPTIDND